MFALRAIGLLIPPASAGILARTRGILLILALILLLLALGLGSWSSWHCRSAGSGWRLGFCLGCSLRSQGWRSPRWSDAGGEIALGRGSALGSSSAKSRSASLVATQRRECGAQGTDRVAAQFEESVARADDHRGCRSAVLRRVGWQLCDRVHSGEAADHISDQRVLCAAGPRLVAVTMKNWLPEAPEGSVLSWPSRRCRACSACCSAVARRSCSRGRRSRRRWGRRPG